MALLLNTNDNVIAINYMYKIPVVSRGKNLFDINTNNYAVGYLSQTGTISSSPNNIVFLDYISTYHKDLFIKLNKKAYNIGYVLYDEYYNMIFRENVSNTSKIVINSSYAKYIRFWINLDNGHTLENPLSIDELKPLDIIVTDDETAHYEPYRPPITTTQYLPTPLMANERLTPTTREVKRGVKVFDGSENFIAAGDYCYNIALKTVAPLPSQYDKTSAVCTHYAATSYSNTYNNRVFGFSQRTGANIDTRGLSFSHGGMSMPEFKDFLKSEYDKGTPVTVWYQLVTPTTEPIETIPIRTLRNEEKTIKGTTTIITTDTEVLPTQIEASYKSNKADYVVVNFATADGNVFTTTNGDTYTIKMRKSQYDTMMTNELLNLLEVM